MQTLIVFLMFIFANYLITYLVVSAVLTNSGLKSDITKLRNEVSVLKKLLNEQEKSITDNSNKDS